MSQPQLSVVIACWSGFDGLKNSLSALDKAPVSGIEVIVVANRDLAVWPDRYRWVRFLRLRNGPVARVVYLLMYSQYLGLAARPLVEDFAEDNGSYKASTLARYRNQIRENGYEEFRDRGEQ